jgi:cell division protein FtsQ
MRKNQLKKKQIARREHLKSRVRLTIKMLLTVLVLMAVSGVFIFIYDFFVQTTHFQARRIVITGQMRLTRQQVLNIAGIGPQVNILSVNLTTMRKRLLAEPWIKDAIIKRKIPSELSIHIREEIPLAVLALQNKQRYLINTSGQVFKRQKKSDAIDLPLVTGLTAADLPVPHVKRTDSFQAVMTLFRLGEKKNSPLPLKEIKKISLDREIGITVFTEKKNRTIKLGFGHYPKKIDVLGQLMARLRKIKRFSDVNVIDLFDTDRIVITPVFSDLDG